jgi:hypothetical protein
MKTLNVDEFVVDGYLIEYQISSGVTRCYKILEIKPEEIVFENDSVFKRTSRDTFSNTKNGLQSIFVNNEYFIYSFAKDEISLLAEKLKM